MKFWPRSLAVSILLALPMFAHGQLSTQKAMSTFKVSDGLELSLWACEPLFVNPTCMDIDHKGRVWVCESINYRSRLRRRPLPRKEGDRILILEDARGTGRADKVTVFYQAPEILAPLGIAVAKDPTGPGYKVYVCQSPDILLFTDANGDGKADGPPRKLLTGFRGLDHDHGVHGILLGPDGKLYFSVGDQGVRNLRGVGDKKVYNSNNTNCRAGTIWRCNLDGSNLQLIAHNFRNEYEPAVNSLGTVFVSDNDDDGNRQTRICYVMPSGNYGYHPRGRGQTHWHEEQPGIVPKILRTYFGSPTGLCFYEGTLLPEKYRGQLLHTDAGPRHLRCYRLTRQGASFAVEREDMIASTDNWFRPSDVCVAPDGSVFVADWYDPGVGGHGMGDTTRGRIFRLAPKGHRSQVPEVDLQSPQGLRAALASPALSVRYLAIARLRDMKANEARKVLEPALTSRENPFLRQRAFWQLYGRKDLSEGEAVKACTRAIQDLADPEGAILALRVLKDHGVSPADLDQAAQQQLLKHTPAVRREALLQLRDVPANKARTLFYALAKGYPGKDRFYLAALGIAANPHDPERRKALLADFSTQFKGWKGNPAAQGSVLDLVWELRPASMMPALGRQLTDKKLSSEQRARIIDILATSQNSDAGKTLLKVLQQDVPEDVRTRIFVNLKTFLPGKWRALKHSPEMQQATKRLLAREDTRPTGLALIGAAGQNSALDQVIQLANSKKESASVRLAAIRALGELTTVKAVEALRTLTRATPAEAQEAVKSLGNQLGMRGRRPTHRLALSSLQDVVLRAEAPLAVQREAIEGLAGNKQGTKWLLNTHAGKKLPKGLVKETGRLLRNTPFRDLRAKAMLAFPPPGRLNPKKLPLMANLLVRKGNPGRGRKLLLASLTKETQCLKCHMIQGQGGQIGPDLSVIGKKGSKENLFTSILYPSKAIADQFINWQVETKRGLALVGLIVEDTPTHITIRDANGKDRRIAKKDIESKRKSPKSLMPENLLVFMTEDDLVDMVAYLATLKTPALSVPSWNIVGPFDNGQADAGMDRVYPPEKKVDLKARYTLGGKQVGWRTVKPNATGYVDLQAHYSPQSNNIVSYLHQEVESPIDQPATILLGTDDAAKLWINGKLVHTTRAHRAAEPGQDTVKVNLRKGRNQLLLKINNGDGPHGLYFTLLVEQEVKLAGK